MKYVYRPNDPNCDEFGMVMVDIAKPIDRGPMVISDHMEPMKHHGTGRILDSKSEFRKDTKSMGCIEVGNEAIKPKSPIKLDRRQRRDDIRKAIYELRNR
jgi:hypothetical protein